MTSFNKCRHLVNNLPDTNPYSLALGIGTIVIIFAIRRYKPLVPGALIALILGTMITSYFDLNALYGVSVVGYIPPECQPYQSRGSI